MGDGNYLCSWPSLDRVRWKRAAKSPEVLNVKPLEAQPFALAAPQPSFPSRTRKNS